MKWFKHESRAHRDAKLQKVLMKYGFEGYGLYWYCIENVCGGLDPKLTFELESDSEILAYCGRMDSRKVEEIMSYMVNLGLFEESASVITCLKLARYLGESGTRNENLKQIIRHSKHSDQSQTVSDKLQTVSDSLRLSPLDKRTEENITEHKHSSGGTKRKRFIPPSREEVVQYIAEHNLRVDPDLFINHYESNGWKVGRNSMKSWKHAIANWSTRNEEKTNGKGGEGSREDRSAAGRVRANIAKRRAEREADRNSLAPDVLDVWTQVD